MNDGNNFKLCAGEIPSTSIQEFQYVINKDRAKKTIVKGAKKNPLERADKDGAINCSSK